MWYAVLYGPSAKAIDIPSSFNSDNPVLMPSKIPVVLRGFVKGQDPYRPRAVLSYQS